jgi:hypothetical protein
VLLVRSAGSIGGGLVLFPSSPALGAQPCLFGFDLFSLFLVLVVFADEVAGSYEFEAAENDHCYFVGNEVEVREGRKVVSR